MQKDRYLFRGKKQNGEWLHGDLVHYGDKILIFSENAQNSPDYYEVDPETVGQFTGLTDKNGVKIFEGDILVDKDGSILVVKFGQFKAGKDDYDIEYMPVGFHILFYDDGTYCINSYGDGYAISANECSIVGNIIENPELLK